MDVLVHLLAHNDRVVSADELLNQVWPDRHGDPGMVKKRIGQIRRAIGDDAKQPVYIETIPKRGYRAIAPVSTVDQRTEEVQPSIFPGCSGALDRVETARTVVNAISQDLASPIEAATGTNARPDRHRYALRIVGILVAGLALAYWWISTLREDAEPERMSIAVEPLTYPTGDARLEGYAQLLSNEVALHLRRIAGPRVDLVENARDAEFLAKGSLIRLADGARLFIQVIETDSGVVMWSNSLKLSREPSDELIATRPEHFATLIIQVASMWAGASRLTESPEAIRELIAGMIETNEMWHGLGGDWNAALVHFEKANELDPQFILAPFSLANLYVNRMGQTLRYEQAAGLAHAQTRRVLELNENLGTWLGTWLAGWVATHDLDYEAAAANYEHASGLGLPATYLEFSLGLLALIQGQLDDAIGRFNTTLELGARENQAMAHVFIAYAQLLAGRYAVAKHAARTAVVETAGTGPYAHLLALNLKARAEWYNGDRAEARKTAEQAWSAYGDTHPQALAGMFALIGNTEIASGILRNSEARWNEGEAGLLSSYFWGYYYLGELDRAFLWLGRAIEDRQVGFVAALRRSPALNAIRDDPRFLAAMVRLAEIEREGTPITSVAYP